jgi:hypothetical protein
MLRSPIQSKLDTGQSEMAQARWDSNSGPGGVKANTAPVAFTQPLCWQTVSFSECLDVLDDADSANDGAALVVTFSAACYSDARRRINRHGSQYFALNRKRVEATDH